MENETVRGAMAQGVASLLGTLHNGGVTWLWISLVLVVAAGVAVVVKVRFGQHYVERRIAEPLAEVERSCQDALAELCVPGALFSTGAHSIEAMALGIASRRSADAAQLGAEVFPQADGSRGQVYVSAFAPEIDRLARCPRAFLATLGPKAVAEYEQLMHAIATWNGVAGRRADPHKLLPTMMTAHLAARALASHIGDDTLASARRQAEDRILHGLVATPPAARAWRN